jgi:hypothetical protein
MVQIPLNGVKRFARMGRGENSWRCVESWVWGLSEGLEGGWGGLGAGRGVVV